ncbi:MAG: PPOX class F420-dependent oxidoreductase [Acidimicrobiales bacterium]
MALSDENYILLTTYKKDGTPVAAPVWIVPLEDGKFGFSTSSGSGKYKRLRHTDRVTVQPCDVRGRVKAGSAAQSATASLVSGALYLEIRTKVKSKYGWKDSASRILGVVGGIVKRNRIPVADVGVVITLTA